MQSAILRIFRPIDPLFDSFTLTRYNSTSELQIFNRQNPRATFVTASQDDFISRQVRRPLRRFFKLFCDSTSQRDAYQERLPPSIVTNSTSHLEGRSLRFESLQKLLNLRRSFSPLLSSQFPTQKPSLHYALDYSRHPRYRPLLFLCFGSSPPLSFDRRSFVLLPSHRRKLLYHDQSRILHGGRLEVHDS